MDVDEHERPFYITLNCCSAFQRHSRLFNNEQNSYPKM